jgi:hypothetical protein
MAESKPQFDILLGGTQNLPLDFSVRRFAAARAQEIAALTQSIGKYNVTVNKLYRFNFLSYGIIFWGNSVKC